MGQKLCILSIDGGGLRGLIPVKILQHIEAITGKSTQKMFKLISGTSTGALIACGISLLDKSGTTSRYNLQELEDIYTTKADEIFPRHSWLTSPFFWLRAWAFPKHYPTGLHKELTRLFNNLVDIKDGTARLANCAPPLFITSYDIKNNKTIFFKSRYADDGLNESLYKICRATSAAPTYLPAFSFRYDHANRTFVDGGVFMNNPSLGALVELWKHKGEKIYGGSTTEDDEIYLLSIGTGHYTGEIISGTNIGKIGWARPISDIMMAGQSQTADYQVKEALTFANNINYLRLDVDINDANFKEMDDSSKKTQAYLLKLFDEQYLRNSTKQEQLNKFLYNSGIMPSLQV